MMPLNPFPIVWIREPARIALPANAAEVLDNVRERSNRWSPSRWFKDGCVGIVSDTRVRLQRYRALRRNDFSPVLDARLIAQGGPPVLEGEWRASWATRIFLSFWFGMVIAFIPLFFLAGLGNWQRDRVGAIAFMIGPSVMFLLGRGTLSFSQRRWEADKHYVERFIAESAHAEHRP